MKFLIASFKEISVVAMFFKKVIGIIIYRKALKNFSEILKNKIKRDLRLPFILINNILLRTTSKYVL